MKRILFFRSTARVAGVVFAAALLCGGAGCASFQGPMLPGWMTPYGGPSKQDREIQRMAKNDPFPAAGDTPVSRR